MVLIFFAIHGVTRGMACLARITQCQPYISVSVLSCGRFTTKHFALGNSSIKSQGLVLMVQIINNIFRGKLQNPGRREGSSYQYSALHSGIIHFIEGEYVTKSWVVQRNPGV